MSAMGFRTILQDFLKQFLATLFIHTCWIVALQESKNIPDIFLTQH